MAKYHLIIIIIQYKKSSLLSPSHQLCSTYSFDVEKPTACDVFSYTIRENVHGVSFGKHQLFQECHNYKNSLQKNALGDQSFSSRIFYKQYAVILFYIYMKYTYQFWYIPLKEVVERSQYILLGKKLFLKREQCN